MTMAALQAQPLSARSATHWLRAHPREAATAGLLLAGVLGSIAVVADPAGSLPRAPTAEEKALAQAPRPDLTSPFAVRAVSPEQAAQINAALPVAAGDNPPARPFVLNGADRVAYARALECLSQAVYYEAALESTDGQRAVAQVVLNRARHPAYPNSVCGVVYQGHERPTGCQFTFTCDGSLSRAPMRGYWDRARQVAEAALAGYVHAPVGNATHYHANYVAPYWAPTLVKSAVEGAHIFYRWPGTWGRPAAFAQRYAGRELDPSGLRRNALAAEARHAAAAPMPGAAVEAAKQGLPPELAKLVKEEIGPKGQARISLRLAPGAKEAARKATENLKVERGERSSNLDWALGGGGAAEKPLSRDPGTSGQQAAAAKVAPAGQL
jgi:spore germination cell wall hydrolase CwlJ-like protein